jgi:hypothetical protein
MEKLAGGVPERPKGTGCKPVGSAYAGSNPASPIARFSGVRGPAEPGAAQAFVKGRPPPLRHAGAPSSELRAGR